MSKTNRILGKSELTEIVVGMADAFETIKNGDFYEDYDKSSDQLGQLHKGLEALKTLRDQIDDLRKKAATHDDLRDLLGFYQNGSDRTVSISCDPYLQPKSYVVRIDNDPVKFHTGENMAEAISQANLAVNPPLDLGLEEVEEEASSFKM